MPYYLRLYAKNAQGNLVQYSRIDDTTFKDYEAIIRFLGQVLEGGATLSVMEEVVAISDHPTNSRLIGVWTREGGLQCSRNEFYRQVQYPILDTSMTKWARY